MDLFGENIHKTGSGDLPKCELLKCGEAVIKGGMKDFTVIGQTSSDASI